MDASVIIPALNARKTIERAVRSAMEQTLTLLEIIVVDDGSTDGTDAIVADLSVTDSRVRLIRHATREGVSAARNTAIATASGEWIAILDADDWFAHGRLAELVGYGRAEGLDAVIDNLVTVDASTGKVLGHAFPSDWMTTASLMDVARPVELDIPNRQRMGLGYCKPIFRRSSFLDYVGQYDTRFRCGEDLLALQLLLFGGGLVKTIESAGYFYSIDPKSHSNRPGTNLDISDINRLLTREARRRGLSSVVPVLDKRQVVLDYAAFAKAAYQRRVAETLIFLCRVPLRVLVMQPLRVLGKRFGVNLEIVDPRDPGWHRPR